MNEGEREEEREGWKERGWEKEKCREAGSEYAQLSLKA